MKKTSKTNKFSYSCGAFVPSLYTGLEQDRGMDLSFLPGCRHAPELNVNLIFYTCSKICPAAQLLLMCFRLQNRLRLKLKQNLKVKNTRQYSCCLNKIRCSFTLDKSLNCSCISLLVRRIGCVFVSVLWMLVSLFERFDVIVSFL